MRVNGLNEPFLVQHVPFLRQSPLISRYLDSLLNHLNSVCCSLFPLLPHKKSCGCKRLEVHYKWNLKPWNLANWLKGMKCCCSFIELCIWLFQLAELLVVVVKHVVAALLSFWSDSKQLTGGRLLQHSHMCSFAVSVKEPASDVHKSRLKFFAILTPTRWWWLWLCLMTWLKRKEQKYDVLQRPAIIFMYCHKFISIND